MAALGASFVGLALAGAAGMKVLKTRRRRQRLPSDVLLVVDMGSSSIRCSVFHVEHRRNLCAGFSFRVSMTGDVCICSAHEQRVTCSTAEAGEEGYCSARTSRCRGNSRLR